MGLSLLLHGLLVYGIIHARFTIKMLTVGTTVQNVRIVPPLKLTLPKVVGAPGGARASSPSPQEAGPAGTGPAVRARRARVEAGAPPAPSPRAAEGPAAQGPTIASLSSKFQQALASRFRTDEDAELKIVLGPPGSKAGAAAAPVRGKAPDFYQYIPGVTATGGGGFGAGGARGGSGTGSGQRASISIPLKGYNLAPWAQKVLEIIQKNWELPWVGGLTERIQVRIILVIRKSGDASSVELVEGTARDALDQAALKAVRTSLPFPALPDDFPGDFLEATIEFTYHD